MARQSHQLEREEAALARWWLGGALAVLAGATAFALDAGARVLFGVLCASVVIVAWRPHVAARWARMWRRAFLPAVAAMLALDVMMGNRPFPAGARVVMLALLCRAVMPRGVSGERQLAGLGLLLVIMGGVAVESVWFALHLAAFVSGALLLFYLGGRDAGEAHASGDEARQVNAGRWWRRVVREDWRVWLPGVVFFAAIVTGGTVAFLAAPRMRYDTGFPVMERLFAGQERSGFSDTIRFGGVAAIQADDAVAFRADLGAGGAGALEAARGVVLYWPMIVLDEYRNREFRMSAALRAAAFGPRETVRQIGPAKTDADAWTFYLEPGAGRYVPLPERFSGITFSKSVKARVSETLGVVELDSAPGKMMAYRAVAQDAGRDSRFVIFGLRMRDDGVEEADREVLREAAREIRDGREMSAGEFARAACAWLGARHAYSLTSSVPGGSGGDPLVRWAVSRAAGHCELFAGALVLLSREAGFDARVVAGFAGGELNGDHVVVRNSQAHAWCEVFDAGAANGAGAWMRVDPTLWAGGAAGDSDVARPKLAAMRAGVAAWADSWRVRWYRHVSDFGEREQGALWLRVKNACGAAWNCAIGAAKACAAFPWLAILAAAAGAIASGVWLWRVRREGGDAFARREAGRWLQKLSTNREKSERGVRGELLRVRFGRRENWPELRGVWRAARREWRERRMQK